MKSPPGRSVLEDGVDSSLQAAVEASHLSIIPPETIGDLIGNASRYRVSAGSILRREADRERHFELVVSGLLRVYVSSVDGRTLTVRYCRPGSIVGAVSLFVSSFSMPASIQAVTDASILALPPALMRQAAEKDVLVARALFNELSERVLSFTAEIPGNAFATVRQRVARHLLDLAVADRDESGLTAEVSQQDLADSVGSVREVVVRILRELREEGILETGRGAIKVLDPVRLSVQASGTNVSDG